MSAAPNTTVMMTSSYEDKRLTNLRKDFSNILGLLKGQTSRESIVQLMEAMEERNVLLDLKHQKELADAKAKAPIQKSQIAQKLAEAKKERDVLLELKRQKDLADAAQAKARVARENSQRKAKELAEAKKELERLRELKRLRDMKLQKEMADAAQENKDSDYSSEEEDNDDSDYSSEEEVDDSSEEDGEEPLPYGIKKRQCTGTGMPYFVHPETHVTSYNLEYVISMVEKIMKLRLHTSCRSRRHGTLRSVERVNYKE
jgi:hypothetical protein